jgi:hypothetical protein
MATRLHSSPSFTKGKLTMFKLVAPILLALALLSSSASAGGKVSSGPVSGPRAKAHVLQRLKYSSKFRRKVDPSGPWTSHLGGKKGDKVRPFFLRGPNRIIPGNAPAGALGGTRSGFDIVRGRLDTVTGEVRTTDVGHLVPTPRPQLTPPR